MKKYVLTTINMQGDEQSAFEVYADKNAEQTIAFVFDELLAKQIGNIEFVKGNLQKIIYTDNMRVGRALALQALNALEGT